MLWPRSLDAQTPLWLIPCQICLSDHVNNYDATFKNQKFVRFWTCAKTYKSRDSFKDQEFNCLSLKYYVIWNSCLAWKWAAMNYYSFAHVCKSMSVHNAFFLSHGIREQYSSQRNWTMFLMLHIKSLAVHSKLCSCCLSTIILTLNMSKLMITTKMEDRVILWLQSIKISWFIRLQIGVFSYSPHAYIVSPPV